MSGIRAQSRVVVAFARKDLATALSYRFGFALSLTAPVYGVILFYFISRVVGTSPTVGDADGYFQFVVVGIALGDVMRSAVAAAAAAARRDQVQGSLENLMAEPLPVVTLALAWTAYPLTEAFLRSAITVLVALPLGLASADLNVFPIVVTLIMTAFAFVSFGLIGAALVLAFQQGAGAVAIFMGLLALLSGALFPVEVLPEPLLTLSSLSPLSYAYEAARDAALDGASLGDVLPDLVVLFGFGLVALPLSVLLLQRASRFARARGKLSTF